MAPDRDSLHIRLRRATWGCLVLAASAAVGQQPAQWKNEVNVRRQLAETVGLTWQDRSLRDGLASLSQEYGIAVFLDRRIDPGRPITLKASEQPLETLFNQIASQAQAEMALLGPVLYMGPTETAAQVATLAALRRQDVAKLANEAKARLLRSQPWQWNELAQPRQLLDDLARQASVRVENPNAIPLDLWPAVSLPSLPWVDRLTILLAGFGLTFQIDERAAAIRLVPQPAGAVLVKRYSPRSSAEELAAQLRRVMTAATIKVEQGQLMVAARQEDHEKIERLLSGQSVRMTKAAKPGDEKLYTLHMSEQPAGAVVRKLAGDLGKELKYDPEVLDRLKTPVKLDLDKVTLDYLLEKTLKPLGLTYRLSEKSLEIVEQP